MPQTNNEELAKKTAYENRMREIKDALATGGYDRNLDVEFVELWKNEPEGVSVETSENIDEIRNLLMDGAPEEE